MNLKLTYPAWVKIVLWAILLAALYALYYSVFLNDFDYIFPTIGISLVIFAGVIDSHVSATWITDKEVFYDSFLYKKRLSIDNIDSFENNEYGIKLYAIEGKPKSVTVSNYLKGYNLAMSWAKENIKRRGTDIYEEQFIDAMTDESFGGSTPERFSKITEASKHVKWLNRLAWGTPILYLIFPQIQVITIPIMLTIPLAIIGIVIYYKGAIKFYDTEKYQTYFYPNVLTALVVSCITIGLFGMLKYDIYDWNNIWINFVVISILITTVIFYYAPKSLETKVTSKIGTLFFLLLFLLYYSFGTMVAINCHYDTTKPTLYKAIVDRKYISEGKTRSHKIELQEWGPKNKVTTLENVKADYYESVSEGDTVQMIYRNGLLDIAWYQTN